MARVLSIRQVCFTALLLTSIAGWALEAKAPPGWTESARTPDIAVFYRDNPSRNARSLLAIGEFNASPETIFGLVSDVAAFVQYVPYTRESRVVERIGPDDLVGYQRIAAPFTQDRDLYVRVHLTRGSPGNGGVFKDEWFAVPDYRPETGGVIRVRLSEGSWTLEPIDGGKRTRATYTILSSPGGAIPKWIVDLSSRSAVTGLFSALRDRLRK